MLKTKQKVENILKLNKMNSHNLTSSSLFSNSLSASKNCFFWSTLFGGKFKNPEAILTESAGWVTSKLVFFFSMSVDVDEDEDDSDNKFELLFSECSDFKKDWEFTIVEEEKVCKSFLSKFDWSNSITINYKRKKNLINKGEHCFYKSYYFHP